MIWQPGMTLEQMERQVIEKAMIYFQHNKTHTARALDIAIRTLDVKLEKYKSDDLKIAAIKDAERKKAENERLRTRRGFRGEPVAGIEEIRAVSMREQETVPPVSPKKGAALHSNKEKVIGDGK